MMKRFCIAACIALLTVSWAGAGSRLTTAPIKCFDADDRDIPEPAEIEENQIWRHLGNHIQRLQPVLGDIDLVILLSQHRTEDLNVLQSIIDDEDAGTLVGCFTHGIT